MLLLLLTAYPDVGIGDVLREVREIKTSVARVGYMANICYTHIFSNRSESSRSSKSRANAIQYYQAELPPSSSHVPLGKGLQQRLAKRLAFKPEFSKPNRSHDATECIRLSALGMGPSID